MASSGNAGPAGAVPATVRCVVVDHRDSYTWNLVHLIASVTGSLPDVVEHDQTSLAELGAYSHIVLSPGPGHPDEYDWSVLDLPRPIFGVCLGMQGIVTRFGGAVERVVPAHGEVASVTHSQMNEFAGIPSPFQAVRYHSLAAVRLPPALEVTARSADGVVQGVRHRRLPIHGVQFHPESILSEYGAEVVGAFLRGPRETSPR